MKIRVVREAGGLGDLVRCFAVPQGLKMLHPDAEIHFYGLEHYRHAMMGHCPAVDKFIPCDQGRRRPRMAPLDERKWRYLRRMIRYDLEVDLYCPAYYYGEVLTDGAVVEERTHIWCKHAGVPFSYPVWHVLDEEREWAEAWVERLGIEPSTLIALQPFGTTRPRNWPEEHWEALIPDLQAAGLTPVLFDSCNRIAKLPGIHESRLTFSQLGAALTACRLSLTGDSGIFHLSAAVGTPVLGLFGQTSGSIMVQGYPPGIAHYLTNEEIARGLAATGRCKPPCYGRPNRGCGQDCRLNGCRILNSVQPSVVLEKVVELHGRAVGEPAGCSARL